MCGSEAADSGPIRTYRLSQSFSPATATVVMISIWLYLLNIPSSTAVIANKANSANKDRPYSKSNFFLSPLTLLSPISFIELCHF